MEGWVQKGYLTEFIYTQKAILKMYYIHDTDRVGVD